jgi:NADH:ubiquinone oxidoreductase subunit 6 (subunit J)
MALLSRLSTRRSAGPVSSLRVAVALGGLLTLVAVVSAGRHNISGRGSRPSQTFVDYLLSGFLVFMTVGAVAIVYLLWQERDEGLGARDPKARRRKTIATVGVLLAFMLVLVLAREAGFRPRALFHRVAVNHVVTEPGHTRSHRPVPAVESRFRWLPAALVGAFFVAVVLLAAYATARRRVRAEDTRGAAEEVAAALDDSVDDLRAEPDARRAIIAAYARMERALGTVGLRREPAEAPLEYLARALEGLKASGVSVRRLTELFRVAKFSDHPLGAEDKEHAISALLTVRDELRAES